MNLKASRSDKPIPVRLPAALRDRLTAAAAAEGRSRNSEIIKRLSDSFQVPPTGRK